MLVKIVEDSVAHNGKRITTLQLRYQRFIHAEFMTHRMFSRNASSSRAIPVPKMIEQVIKDPAMPVHWGKNQPGMQANAQLEDGDLLRAMELWRSASLNMASIAEQMMDLGLHKQVANRILEPFQFINVVVTATEWDNFFELRTHKDAQPEFQVLAKEMQAVMKSNTPKYVKAGDWHLPYVQSHERGMYPIDLQIQMSAARCARVSYLKHDNTKPNVEDDIALYNRLITSKPAHASPIEHQATPLVSECCRSNNFYGWEQYRATI